MLYKNSDALWQLLQTKTLPQLGPQRREDAFSQDILREKISPDLIPAFVVEEQKDIFRGAILLWHDDLEGAHAIAQTLEGDQDADLLHAMLHRREPDYPNAKYWYRQVGKHACYIDLAETAGRILGDFPEWRSKLFFKNEWNPDVFVDWVEHSMNQGMDKTQYQILQELQFLEMEQFIRYLTTGWK